MMPPHCTFLGFCWVAVRRREGTTVRFDAANRQQLAAERTVQHITYYKRITGIVLYDPLRWTALGHDCHTILLEKK